MRKWISLLLALVLLLNGIPVLKVHAEDQQERAVAALRYQDSDLQDAVCRPDHIMYWTMIDQIAGIRCCCTVFCRTGSVADLVVKIT